ncbi:hypothetical protein PQO01_17645 [Lentisphaera marina]|uniref:hypothetical protein n=1 Tax=Lentisphaera marina TaxID=1111041 RepID=UPI0023668203|nr:hypothetical protein [Lentisphaera marina]MDD7986777.1 hypothetical protein [Lentisphaera marina]
MITLANQNFTVEILDPSSDHELLGARYCRGGQIFQVKDREGRDLFSGPTYPEAYNAFDSQGLPDAFNSYPNFSNAQLGDEIFVIGVGRVKYNKAIETFFACDNREVAKAVQWKVTQEGQKLTFKCDDSYQGFAYHLEKILELKENSIEQKFNLLNTGEHELPVSWFAHPFFFHRDDLVFGDLPVEQNSNPLYFRNERNEITIRIPQNFDEVRDQTFVMGQAIQNEENLHVPVKHKLLDDFSIDCHFSVAQFPLWYNEKTISPEPFLIQDLAVSEKLNWAINYNLA